MSKFTKTEEKEILRQLEELESWYNENPNIVCDDCETPLVVDSPCFDMMSESSSIDWEAEGFVQHVVARCENSFAHTENCWDWNDEGGMEYDCGLNTGSDDPKGYDNKVCHNGYEWVDIWDKRFSKNPEDKTLFPNKGIKILETND
jgi:hypothetical protein